MVQYTQRKMESEQDLFSQSTLMKDQEGEETDRKAPSSLEVKIAKTPHEAQTLAGANTQSGQYEHAATYQPSPTRVSKMPTALSDLTPHPWQHATNNEKMDFKKVQRTHEEFFRILKKDNSLEMVLDALRSVKLTFGLGKLTLYPLDYYVVSQLTHRPPARLQQYIHAVEFHDKNQVSQQVGAICLKPEDLLEDIMFESFAYQTTAEMSVINEGRTRFAFVVGKSQKKLSPSFILQGEVQAKYDPKIKAKS